MTLFEDLVSRGLAKQVTESDLPKALLAGPLTLYSGFDPTAEALHVGSLLPILTLRRFQLAGHRPIAVVGGATGMIGDPSGKSQERQLLSPAELEHNVVAVKKSLERFLDFSPGKNTALLVNNASWFQGISYIDFLRDAGKHFTINHMMGKESVRARLEDREHGISYTEFSYMLMQAYDFHILHARHGCSLQIGGSDQWGNITAGCELIRRLAAERGEPAAQVHGLTFPLVTKSDGSKYGKTETGNVWLDPRLTSPYQFYQFFLQTPDADVGKMLRFFTFLPLSEIESLERETRDAPEKRQAQRALARELVRLVHGETELAGVEKTSEALFGKEIRSLDPNALIASLSDAPSSKRSRAELGSLLLVELLVATGLCKSKGEARKEIQAGGIYINNERTIDPQLVIGIEHLLSQQHLVLRKGKKNYHLLTFA